MARGSSEQVVRLALDGPSALAFYRDRDSVLAQVRKAERHGSRRPPTHVDPDGDPWLSDEDVAATLAATKVFGYAPEFDPNASAGRSALAGKDAPHVYGLSSEFGSKASGGNGAARGRNAHNAQDRFAAADLDDWDEDSARRLVDVLMELRPTQARRLAGCAYRSRELKTVPFDALGLRPPTAESPLYLLAPSADRRRTVRNVRTRMYSTEPPTRSFYLLGGSVYVPTPEHLFVLMAHYLELPALALLAMEMCGNYRVLSATRAPFASSHAVYDVPPLTTVAHLERFVDRCDGVLGLSACRRALRYVANGAASPMESVLYLLLCLSRNLGGYGVRRPLLNARISVTNYAEPLTDASYLVPDLYWSDAHLDMEYDSEEFHSNPQSLVLGARRTLALRTMNVQVLAMTYDVLSDEEAFGATAHKVMRMLGQHPRPDTDKVRARRGALRAALLHKEGLYRAELGAEAGA